MQLHPASNEHVVLVDSDNNIIGSMPKAEVHHDATPLHRGFSIFLFNERDEVLLQRRAQTKVTWPHVWSNSCCGHEQIGEAVEAAAIRRINFELGSSADTVTVILPSYSYRAEYNGVVENEFCPVMVGKLQGNLVPNGDEVADIKWLSWDALVERCQAQDPELSPWCIEEVLLLDRSAQFQRYRSAITTTAISQSDQTTPPAQPL